jgi:hypothetical protein
MLLHLERLAVVDVREALDARQDDLYERDSFLWFTTQIRLLKEQRFDRLDLAHLIEELENMAGRHRRAIRSDFIALVTHLLKYAFQPERRTTGWTGSIARHRRRILQEIEDSPSLASYPAQIFERCHLEAREQAAAETGLAESHFPKTCPWPVEEVLKRGFLPD